MEESQVIDLIGITIVAQAHDLGLDPVNCKSSYSLKNIYNSMDTLPHQLYS